MKKSHLRVVKGGKENREDKAILKQMVVSMLTYDEEFRRLLSAWSGRFELAEFEADEAVHEYLSEVIDIREFDGEELMKKYRELQRA